MLKTEGSFSIPGNLFCSNPKQPNLIQGRPNILFNGNQRGLFGGSMYKGPHPLLWVKSRVLRGKFGVSCIPNNINYCAIFISYTQLTILIKVCIIDCWGRGMDTHYLYPNGLHFTYAQRNCEFQVSLSKYF